MSPKYNISLPQGVKNFVPDEAGELKNTEGELLDEFFKWGYKLVITPLFENLDTITTGLSEKLKSRVMKFVDPSTGEVVALRPDITPQISRIVATRLNHVREPLRLCYSGRVVRFEQKSSGREREVFQAGCEFVGKKGAEADAEAIALSVAALERLGLSSGLVLDIGHAGVLDAIDKLAGDRKTEVRRALAIKSRKDLAKGLASAGLPAHTRKTIFGITETRDPEKALRQMDKLRILKPYANKIRKILEVVLEHEVKCEICMDICDVREFNYYTGATFQILHKKAPSPLIVGGRYDSLIKRYGYDIPATGFAADIEGIAKTSAPEAGNGRQEVHFVVVPMKPSLRKEAISLSLWLRSNGFQVIAETKPGPLPSARGKDDMPPTYGIIAIDSHKKLRLIESKNKTVRQFSNLEELIAGGI